MSNWSECPSCKKSCMTQSQFRVYGVCGFCASKLEVPANVLPFDRLTRNIVEEKSPAIEPKQPWPCKTQRRIRISTKFKLSNLWIGVTWETPEKHLLYIKFSPIPCFTIYITISKQIIVTEPKP